MILFAVIISPSQIRELKQSRRNFGNAFGFSDLQEKRLVTSESANID